MGKVSQLESMVKVLQEDLKKVRFYFLAWKTGRTCNNLSMLQLIKSICGFIHHQEKDAKATLQAQIESLREDNQRLVEESYSASAKLKKFTEWVFNTIDMN